MSSLAVFSALDVSTLSVVRLSLVAPMLQLKQIYETPRRNSDEIIYLRDIKTFFQRQMGENARWTDEDIQWTEGCDDDLSL